MRSLFIEHFLLVLPYKHSTIKQMLVIAKAISQDAVDQSNPGQVTRNFVKPSNIQQENLIWWYIQSVFAAHAVGIIKKNSLDLFTNSLQLTIC